MDWIYKIPVPKEVRKHRHSLLVEYNVPTWICLLLGVILIAGIWHIPYPSPYQKLNVAPWVLLIPPVSAIVGLVWTGKLQDAETRRWQEQGALAEWRTEKTEQLAELAYPLQALEPNCTKPDQWIAVVIMAGRPRILILDTPQIAASGVTPGEHYSRISFPEGQVETNVRGWSVTAGFNPGPTFRVY